MGEPSKAGGASAFGGLVIDYGARTVSLDGQPVSVTRSEFDLLTCLARNPGVVVPSAELLSYIWQQPWVGDETSIETHISRLRRKLGESASSPRYIWTIRGVGYRLEPGLHEETEPVEAMTDPAGGRARAGRRGRRLAILTAVVLVAGALGFVAFRYLNPATTPGECAAGYEPCLPVAADLDCAQIRQPVTVTGDDPYGLDRDGDGLGCQLYAPAPEP